MSHIGVSHLVRMGCLCAEVCVSSRVRLFLRLTEGAETGDDLWWHSVKVSVCVECVHVFVTTAACACITAGQHSWTFDSAVYVWKCVLTGFTDHHHPVTTLLFLCSLASKSHIQPTNCLIKKSIATNLLNILLGNLKLWLWVRWVLMILVLRYWNLVLVRGCHIEPVKNMWWWRSGCCHDWGLILRSQWKQTEIIV